MYNHSDKEGQEVEAIKLIDAAENYADKGKGDEAINYYERAAQIYLDLGSYLKLDEIYIRITNIISKFKNNIQATYRLKSIIRKTEELELNEISAKLLIQLGNVSYKMNDWETAAESWSRASKYLYDIDPEEYYNLSSILLLKAGQALERSGTKKDEGERLIMKAVMQVSKFEDIYNIEQTKAISLLKMKEFEAASNKFFEIGKIFKQAIKSIDEMIEDRESEGILKNTKSRFMHLSAEFDTLGMLSLRISENSNYNNAIKASCKEIMELLAESINLLKSVFNLKRLDIDNEDILRITFDGFLLDLIQEILGDTSIIATEFIIEGLSNHKAINKLKKSPFYGLAERIEKIGILDSVDKIKTTNFGRFNEIKDLFISYIK
jgi:tetratricopeptide (TPR) repeat protein